MNRGREAAKSNCKTSLKNYQTITSKEVFQEAFKGDKEAKRIIDNALNYLGITFANAANIFDPDMIVLGGGVSNAGPIVFEKIAEVMEERCMTPIYNHCKVAKAELGGKAGVLGAAALAITESK